MLALTRVAMRVGLEFRVRMLGRWAVWPTMTSLFLTMCTATPIAEALLYVGIALSLGATFQYLQDGWRHVRPSSSG
jgi:hypothetical protein